MLTTQVQNIIKMNHSFKSPGLSNLINLPNDVACDLYMKPGENSYELGKNGVPIVRSGHEMMDRKFGGIGCVIWTLSS